MAVTKWNIDPAHSSIEFTVRHLMISKVKGTFKSFSADLEGDPDDYTTAKISFEIDAASIDTKNEQRDQHLRSTDFFDVDNHPKITFVSKKIEKKNDNEYLLTGDVTMRGVTKEETFTVHFGGIMKDPMGAGEKAGFQVEGVLRRSDYGLTWNVPLETGGVLVSDEVNISLDLQVFRAG